MYKLDHKPRRPAVKKPILKAIERQRRTEQRLKLFDAVYGAFMLVLLLVFLTRLSAAMLTTPWHIANVGDRLMFQHGAPQPAPSLTIPARLITTPWSKPGAPCMLDTAQLFATGSTTTVIAARPDGVMLSLAGAPATAKTECHPGTQLLVSNTAYEQLFATQFPPRANNPR